MMELGYYHNFKGGDTLLFAGSGDDINELYRFFKQWDGRECDLVHYLQSHESICLHSVKALLLKRDVDWHKLSWLGDRGTWSISQEAQTWIVGLLESLREANHAAHQYLDHDGDAVQIMVSKDEYPNPSKGSKKYPQSC
jgi:hypothetical protein